MKEMIYKMERTFNVLDKGKKGEFLWFICSYGTHPCAYVAIPKGHKFYGKHYDNINISCHGGLTFAAKEHRFQITDIPNVWWIGWDYIHAGDYAGYHEMPALKEITAKYNNLPEKKWTTLEARKEVFRVIKQLNKK